MRLHFNQSHSLISKFNAEILHQKDILEKKINELDEAALDADLKREQLEVINEFLEVTMPIQERLEIMIR